MTERGRPVIPRSPDSVTSGLESDGPLILAVDVGNTRVKFGLFATRPSGARHPQQLTACRIEDGRSAAAELQRWVSQHIVASPAASIIAGSDPETRDRIVESWPWPDSVPHVIRTSDQIPIAIDVEHPERVGLDRLLNTLAVHRMFAQDRATIVVDSGTATTVDLVTADGTFRGGSILPGLRLSALALHEYTARLPLINVDDERSELPPLPGRNTQQAMEAGLFIGQLGAVRELVSGLSRVARGPNGSTGPPRLIVTGGGGRQLVRHLDQAQFVDCLALHGLALLAEVPGKDSASRHESHLR